MALPTIIEARIGSSRGASDWSELIGGLLGLAIYIAPDIGFAIPTKHDQSMRLGTIWSLEPTLYGRASLHRFSISHSNVNWITYRFQYIFMIYLKNWAAVGPGIGNFNSVHTEGRNGISSSLNFEFPPQGGITANLSVLVDYDVQRSEKDILIFAGVHGRIWKTKKPFYGED